MSDNENNIEALLLQVQVMSSVLDNIGSYVYSKDLAGKYTYVNADVAKLFQTSVQDIIGKDDSHFFDLDISNEINQNDLKVIRNKAPLITEENNVIKSTGKVNTYQIIKKPILDNKGNVIGISGISVDITEKKALEAENQEQKYLLDVILDNVDAYIYMKDDNRYFRYVNDRVAKLFGLPAKDIIGKRDIDVISQADADHFWQTDKLAFESNDKVIINETLKAADNKIHHYLSVKVPCHFKDDYKTLIGFSTDVTELYQLKEKFEQLANIDELTGLYNRRYFFDNANREFNRAERHQQALAVISIDVDRFKTINDKYGHPVGDQVLVKVAQLITPTVRSEDIFARIGGEEFSILLPNTSRHESQQTAERLRHLLDNNPISITDDISLPIKISLGVSVLKAADTSFQDLYARSDIALYKAKSMGRNNVYLID
ncbi:sensor domain-containing diguanylate cyclase [Cognaticolwellia aestuarii]|uniref:sensor domain-containing diguanylate cyclase n=1 Tax=Cognaticolwellia aestuarii TaxID=329993 RepID=UPI0009840C21|nr:sensor domain-containing diguanylate cyclase [Cognaticolwellia aestuarii]